MEKKMLNEGINDSKKDLEILREKLSKLKEFFKGKKFALAFSGGVDSSLLLKVGNEYADSIRAYYVKSDFQPEFEYQDALRLIREEKADYKVLPLDILKDEKVVNNPLDRCYYCKKNIFSLIYKEAADDGFTILIDGTNASDSYEDRPGMKALDELKVLSPLRNLDITKKEVRLISKNLGLFTWDKDSYSCLATRIKPLERITMDRLLVTEKSENFLFSLGFKDFRVRSEMGIAIIELRKEDMEDFINNRERIDEELRKYYDRVLLNLKAR